MPEPKRKPRREEPRVEAERKSSREREALREEDLTDPTEAVVGAACQLAKQGRDRSVLACADPPLFPAIQAWVSKAPFVLATRARTGPEEW